MAPASFLPATTISGAVRSYYTALIVLIYSTHSVSTNQITNKQLVLIIFYMQVI